MTGASLAHEAREKLADGLNAHGRSPGHVATGVAICTVLVGAVAALSAARPQPPTPGQKPTRHRLSRALWPSLFSVTTLAALRVWNAPSSPARTRALGFWSLLQAGNLVLTAWSPRRRGERVAAALTTAALAGAYAHAASYVDPKAAKLSAPVGFAGLAAVVAEPHVAHGA